MIIEGKRNALGNKLLETALLHSVVFQTNSTNLNAFINVVICLLYITYSK